MRDAGFAPLLGFLRLLAAVHFRGIEIRHAGRFAQGAVLLAANHPATWTDVLVLHAALGRKLHFLAHQALFRPRPRAWLLRLFGALPIASGRDARNDTTFRRCRALLEQGHVVAIFPEGVSAPDDSLKRFRNGAARIAFDALERRDVARLIPVGIHYADRAAFRTRVTVSVGHPVDLPAHRGLDRDATETWIVTVTARLEAAVRGLVVDVPDPSLRDTIDELAPLVPVGPASDPARFERSRRLARWLALQQRAESPRVTEISRHARRHRRLREVLGLDRTDSVVSTDPALPLGLVAGAAPALLGMIVHAPPALATVLLARRFDVTRVALFRITAGGTMFVVWYAGIAAMMVARGAGPWLTVAAALAAMALGACALRWNDGWREAHARLRWRWWAWRRPRAAARLARERAVLTGLLAGSPLVPHPARLRAEAGDPVRASPTDSLSSVAAATVSREQEGPCRIHRFAFTTGAPASSAAAKRRVASNGCGSRLDGTANASRRGVGD